MNRRTFLQNVMLAAGAALLPLPVVDEYEHNLTMWRKRLIEIVMMQGCTIKSAWLEPEVDGYRFATVWLEGIESPLFFRQPWGRKVSSRHRIKVASSRPLIPTVR